MAVGVVMALHIGIDPGVSGAVAVLEAGVVVDCFDMPTLRAGGKKGRRIVDIRMLRQELAALNAIRKVRVTLEEVHSVPRDGHVGAFSFGRAYGTIEAILSCLDIPFLTVRPQVWKKRMGVTGDKDHARAIASQRLPSGAKSWPLKSHHGRAEAALLALYGATCV